MKRLIHFKKHSRWRLALQILPIVIIIVLIKTFTHHNDWEFLSLSSLFTALISANIFLIGFLITGTLSDYKESEKLPSDIASSLETLADEGLIIYRNKKAPEAKKYVSRLLEFNNVLIDWFNEKKSTKEVLSKVGEFNHDFLAFEALTQANFIVRLKQEQNSIRKLVNRIHTIRTTSFLATGYVIAEIITVATIIGLIFIRIHQDVRESLFFTGFVGYILIYMIFFIKDLDNPFGYTSATTVLDEVSLKPLLDSKNILEEYTKEVA